MSKSLCMKPAPHVELIFEDGEVINLKFNTRADFYINEYREFKNNYNSLIAFEAILYGGIKACDDKFTFEDAEKLALLMSAETASEIMKEYMDGQGEEIKKKQAEIQKSMMEEFTKQMSKKKK